MMTPEQTAAEQLVEAAPVSAADPVPLPRRGLLDRDWQKTLVMLLTLLAGAAVLWVLWQIVSPILRTIMLFVLSAVLAFILAGPVEGLAPRIGGRRFPAILVVYLIAGAVLVGGIVLLAGPFVVQATALAADLPRYASELEALVPEVESALAQYGVRASVDELKVRIAQAVEQGGGEVLTHLAGGLAEVGSLLVDTLLALVISFYLLLDGTTIRQRSLALVPQQHRNKALFVEANVARVLGGYLRGQLVMAVSIGVLAGVGCSLLGLPYAVVLGVLAGLFEMVPMFGPILSAIPAVVVALFLPFPTVVWVVLFFFAIQQLETNILAPRITGHAVGLHPLGALFALLAGFQLAGFLGGLFAVPVAGILWVLVSAGYRNVVPEPRPRRWPIPRLRRPVA